MDRSEQRERNRLHLLWVTGKASDREIERCMELDRKAERQAREAERLEAEVSRG